jgi:ssDNA thymidine ADP-ribosyltransferase, DarT
LADLNTIRIFRMVHIENVPHILEHGLTHQASGNKNPNYRPIGDSSLINARNSKIIENGRKLGDFIPFYFGFRTPMLYVIQKGLNNVAATPPVHIVYCVSSVQKMVDAKLDFMFTDGHAVDGLTSFYTSNEVENLKNLVDLEAVNVRFWKSETDLDLKRRKEAEFLVANDIPSNAIVGWVVFDETAKIKLEQMGIPSEKIAVKPDFYF